MCVFRVASSLQCMRAIVGGIGIGIAPESIAISQQLASPRLSRTQFQINPTQQNRSESTTIMETSKLQSTPPECTVGAKYDPERKEAMDVPQVGQVGTQQQLHGGAPDAWKLVERIKEEHRQVMQVHNEERDIHT